MIRVGNIKNGDKGVYIGRGMRFRKGSPLGNPFKLEREDERGRVIAFYRAHILAKIEAQDPAVLAELRRLQTMHKAGEEVVLLCWCSPKGCHGDVLKELLETMDFGA